MSRRTRSGTACDSTDPTRTGNRSRLDLYASGAGHSLSYRRAEIDGAGLKLMQSTRYLVGIAQAKDIEVGKTRKNEKVKRYKSCRIRITMEPNWDILKQLCQSNQIIAFKI